jgi:hypothetical protein
MDLSVVVNLLGRTVPRTHARARPIDTDRCRVCVAAPDRDCRKSIALHNGEAIFAARWRHVGAGRIESRADPSRSVADWAGITGT